MKLDYIDKDEKYIDFTQNNIDLINFCITIDSSYWNAFDETYIGSSAELIKYHWQYNKETIAKICKQIDKENSTHLLVSGYKKVVEIGESNSDVNKQGLKKVVEKIMSIQDFEIKLKNAQPQLVNEIASAVEGVSKFSFASKFCSYVSRYKFNDHNAYSIYDKVISEILPYYEWKFLNTTNVHARRKQNKTKEIVSTVEDYFAKRGQFDYAGYNELIGEIIEAINIKKKYQLDIKVNRTIFDRVLWYYYKGDKQLRKDALNEIPLP